MKREKIFKIIFIGTSDFAAPSLEALAKNTDFKTALVITQTDKPVGRKRIVTPPPVKLLAKKYNLPVRQPQKIKEAEEEIKKINPDFIVVAAYGQTIPQNILDIPKYGSLNVHASLLPRYRGAAVISAPILAGDRESGITVIKMEASLDTGPIIYQKKIILEKDETAETLHDKLSVLSAKILPGVLKNYASGKLKLKTQDESKSSYIKTLKKEDGRINWKKPAIEIERTARALNPWPGTYSIINYKLPTTNYQLSTKNYQLPVINKILKILKVENDILPVNKYKAGEIFLHNNKPAIQCGQGALVVKKLQLEGKKGMDAEKFLKGQKDFIGRILT